MWFRKDKFRCIECGFLESHCYPIEVTPEPRQSIQDKKRIGGNEAKLIIAKKYENDTPSTTIYRNTSCYNQLPALNL